MKDKRQLLKNIFAQFISISCSLGISFFLTPFLIRHLGVEVYGFVGLANDCVGYLDIITIALNSMAARYITISLEQNDKELARKQFNSVFWGNVVIMAIILVPACLVIANMEYIFDVPLKHLFDIKLLWLLIFANFVFTVITSIFSVSTFTSNRLDIAATIRIKSTLLRAILLFVLFSLLPPYVFFIGITMLTCTGYVFFLNYECTKRYLPDFHIDKEKYSIEIVKEICKSGIWNVVSRLSGILSKGLDLLLANFFIDVMSMGMLSIARTLSQVTLSFFGQISGVFAPQITIAYAKHDICWICEQMKFSIKFLGIITSCVVMFIFAYGEDFYHLWLPNQNANILWYLTMLGSADLIFAMPLESFWNIMTATNKLRLPSLVLLLEGVLTILIVISSISYLDGIYKLYLIAGVSSFLAILRALFFMPIYASYCIGINRLYFYKSIIKNFILFIISFFVIWIIKSFITIDSWHDLFLSVCISCIITFSIGFFINLEKKERSLVTSKISKFKIWRR